jgi:hypothetical protein
VPLPAGETAVEEIDVPTWGLEPIPGSGALNALAWANVLRRLLSETHPSSVIGIGRPTKFAVTCLRKIPHRVSFYDAMDDFPAFFEGLSRRTTSRVEAVIAHQVDRLWVSAPALQEKFARTGSRAQLVSNGCDTAKVPLAPSPAGSRLSFGYVGTIGRWFDWSILHTLAREFPEGEFLLVGPCFVPPPASLPANVKLYPESAHEDALRFLGQCQVGLIPFVANRLTDAVDPIKYYEYRAMGLAVVSTAFGAMRTRGGEAGVRLLKGRLGVRAAVEAALTTRPPLAAVQEFRAQNDWASRFDRADLAGQVAGGREHPVPHGGPGRRMLRPRLPGDNA